MEVGYVRGKASREASPERVKVHLPSKARQLRKVHVIYYLCRNGQLEQPHFMEVPLHPNKHLRLRDVMERLAALRGRAMISLYSWSCKRSYKNGYVWNDLGEDDVIYPSDGGTDYILKGSEILEDCREDIQQLKAQTNKRNPQPLISYSHNIRPAEGTADIEEVEEDDCKVLHQCNYSQTKPKLANSSHCSRGVSTEEELDHNHNLPCNKQQLIELPLDEEGASPPSSASSDKTTIITQEPNNSFPNNTTTTTNYQSSEPQMKALTSVLHHLIACGNPMTMKRRASLLMKSPLSSTTTRKSDNNNNSSGGGGGGGGNCVSGRKSSVGGLQRGVLCRVAAARAVMEDDEMMNEIRYMSENPRFGCQQLEEKEYFSGSIVEAMSTDARGSAPQPSLKKSSSYNEERSSKCRLGDDRVIKVEEKGVKGGCIPSKKRSSSKQQQKAGK